MTPLLTVADVATFLSASERFVLDELRRKNLIGVKSGLGWRIAEDDLAAYVTAHKNVRPVRRAS